MIKNITAFNTMRACDTTWTFDSVNDPSQPCTLLGIPQGMAPVI